MTEQEWANKVSGQIKEKMKIVAERSKGKVPYTTVAGVFDDWTEKNICWWTNGFWGGMMWQLYYTTKDRVFRNIAEELEKKLDNNLMDADRMDHDSGFKWLTTAVANYRLTGNSESRNRGLLAADNLAGRFNPMGNFIRAWNDSEGCNAGWAIIDCMMNLPLLYWAFEEKKDPRYLHIATRHADSVEKYFIREDGSANHIVEFNPMTGDYVQSLRGQGAAVGSSWTRGQAWALYGFCLSYRHIKKVHGFLEKSKHYLDTAKKVADYFVAHIPENNLIPVDFCQPADCAWEDSTAAAIASCGLLELAKHVSVEDSHRYHDSALRLLTALEKERCRFDLDCDNILEKCTAAYHDKQHEFSIIYGDYYFIEAIWKLTEQELFIW